MPHTLIGLFGVTLIVVLGIAAFVMSCYKKVEQGHALIINKMDSKPTVTFTGGVVIPVLHRSEMMDISVKTINIDRRGSEGLQCKDHIRVDIQVSFFVKVNKTPEDVLEVAQSIGCARASDLKTIEELFSARFTEALKVTVRQFDFVYLCMERDQYLDQVIDVIGRDHGGYILHGAALHYLEQTPIEMLDKNNILDVQGIRKITELTAKQNPTLGQTDTDPRSSLIQRVRETFDDRSEEVVQLAMERIPKQDRTIVIGQLDPATAADFLAGLKPEARAEMLVELSGVRMVAGQDARDALRRFLAVFGSSEQTHFEIGGSAWLRTVVHEAGSAGPMLCQVVEDSGRSTLADDLRTQLLTLRHLARWSRIDLTTLIMQLDSDTLTVAMLTAPASFQTAAFTCVSRRAAEDLREEMAILGDRPASFGEEARRTILADAAKLIKDGLVTGLN